MITASAFADKHYAVYGLARSGLATVEALLASGAKVTAWDAKEEARNRLRSSPSLARGGGSRAAADGGAPPPLGSAERSPSPSKLGEDLTIANLDTADLSQFDSLVVTPGLPLNRHPIAKRAREADVEIIGDIELFARARPELPPHKVVGITGTNGKSTTTALVHHILKTAGVPTTMGGNIGLPILAQEPLPQGGVYVLELSSYQIDLTQSLDCDVAVLLNITPDHLDRYDNFEAYFDSKLRLFELQGDPRHASVIGEERFTDIVPNPTLLIGPHWAKLAEQPPALAGPHNLQNIACVLATIEALDIGLKAEDEVVQEGLRTYPGLPHRMERVREKDGVLFVNDSKATNATAAAPALAAFPAIRWILGGRPKSDELDECAPFFLHVRSAYTIGEAAEMFEQLLAPHIPVKNCGKLDEAVRQAAQDAEPGDTVLLSPACASFDQFRDFEDRGQQFKALVGAL